MIYNLSYRLSVRSMPRKSVKSILRISVGYPSADLPLKKYKPRKLSCKGHLKPAPGPDRSIPTVSGIECPRSTEMQASLGLSSERHNKKGPKGQTQKEICRTFSNDMAALHFLKGESKTLRIIYLPKVHHNGRFKVSH